MTTFIKVDRPLTGPNVRYMPSMASGAGGPDLAFIPADLQPNQTLTTWTDSVTRLTGTAASVPTITSNGRTATQVKSLTQKITIPDTMGTTEYFSFAFVVTGASPYASLFEYSGYRLGTSPTGWSLGRIPNGNGFCFVTVPGADVGKPAIVIGRVSGTTTSLQVFGLPNDTNTNLDLKPTGAGGWIGRDTDYAVGTIFHHFALWKRRLTDAEVADVYATLLKDYPFAK